MPDYPINKLTGRLDRFFFNNTNSYYNLVMNRLYDTQEVVTSTRDKEFSAFILSGVENNSTNLSESPDKSIQSVTGDDGANYVRIIIRFFGNPINPTDCFPNPLTAGMSVEDKLFWSGVHGDIVCLMPLEMYNSEGIGFRTIVRTKEINGIYYVTEVTANSIQVESLIQSGALSADFSNPNFGTGLPGSPSGQTPIVIADNANNKKKVPGTVFPAKLERVVTSILGIRGVPPTPQAIASGKVGEVSWHSGIDLGTPNNDPIYSIADGEVDRIGSDPKGAGNYCVIKHTNLKRVDGTSFPCWTKYMHNNEILVKKGDSVSRGAQIAWSGNTGHSTGPHLHFEARSKTRGGRFYEPLWLFDWGNNGMTMYNKHKANYNKRNAEVVKNAGYMIRPSWIPTKSKKKAKKNK